MEIKKFMSLYRKHSPKEFFEWLSQGRTMEIRFLSDWKGKKFNNWLLMNTLSETMNLDKRFNSLYINSYKQLKAILLYKISVLGKNYPLTRLYNIFIGVNPRRKVYVKSKQGLLYKSFYGGIAGTSHIQNILCDIEHKDHPAGSSSEGMLEECIQGAKFIVKQLELENYYINISGNGTHLYFNLENPIELPIPSFVEYDDKVKYNLKEEPIYTLIKTYNRFIEKLNKMLQKYNPNLIVDEGAKDISRIARPTGAWNIKVGKTPRAVGTVVKLYKNNNIINSKFLAAKPIINKVNKANLKRVTLSNKHRFNVLTIHECPLYKLLTSGYLPSTLSRNHYLEQSFARILRDNEIQLSSIPELISAMDIAQRKNVQVDPDYLAEEDQVFNSEMVNSYCIACKLDLIYPLLEDIPEIEDGYITKAHYERLNKYSSSTVEKMSLSVLKDSKTYLQLKNYIRSLVDTKHSRATVFFTIKTLLKDEWEYYDKNKIVLQLLNKTRKRY